MTQTDKKAVERFDCVGLDGEMASGADGEWVRYEDHRAALDAAEAEQKRLARMFHDATEQCIAAEGRERAAVAAAYEKAKEICQLVESAAGKRHLESGDEVDLGHASAAVVIKRRIDALSDTDALAEYVERVRAEAFKEGVEAGFAAAIRQETNDAE